MHTGHDANTRSGTATFAKQNGIFYVCTCRHILESIRNPKMVPGAKFPTLALTIDNMHVNLSFMTANGPELLMRAPGVGPDPDIAMMPLDQGTWNVLTTRKSKTAIDLGNWRESDWSKVRFGTCQRLPG